MLNINIKKITATSLLGILMAGSFFSQAALSDTQAVTIDSGSGYLDWTDASSADANGWERIGDNGERDDLSTVYYHSQDNLYIKVSVNKKSNWGGINKAIEENQLPSFLSEYENSGDPYPNSPKITNYSYWGTGNFDEHETFLFTNNVKKGLGSNTLTIEYFSDAALTQKAEVEKLNFTLTDLDGTSVREKIVMNATDASGNNPQIGFDRPENSKIDDSQMSSNTIVAYNGNITDEKGNVGVVVNGQVHKIEILYTVHNPENKGTSNRHMYVSDVAWGGESAPLVPGTDININQFYTVETPTVEPPANGAPNAVVDTRSTPFNKPVTINVLNNDTDPETDILTIVEVTSPTNGTAVVTDGQVVYTPNANHSGGDPFYYTIQDIVGNKSSAQVIVSVGNLLAD